LPRKDSGKIKWDFTMGKGWYTSVTIRLAMCYGYKLAIKNGFFWRRKGDLFSNYVKRLYDLKCKYGRDNAMHHMYKGMMNSLYGKMLQKPVLEAVRCCNNGDELINTVTEFSEKMIHIERHMIGGKIFIKGKYRSSKAYTTKPSHLGAFTLDYSKVIMFQYMELLQCLHDEKKLYYYINTDCIYVHRDQVTISLTEFLGGIKNEYSANIVQAIFISPKMYYLRLSSGKEIMKMKGINVADCGITKQHYVDMFWGKDIEVVIPFRMFKKMLSNDQYPFSIVHEMMIKHRISPHSWNDRQLVGNRYVPKSYERF
jgi:hypothetical protein